MQLGMFKNLIKALMAGDNNAPSNNDQFIPLVAYAFNVIGMKTESFHLLTLNRKDELLRMAAGDYFIRVPNLPTVDTDELDIDEELVFPAARIICSILSKSKGAQHEAAAMQLIVDYNAKVYQIMEDIKFNFRINGAQISGGRNFDDVYQVLSVGAIS